MQIYTLTQTLRVMKITAFFLLAAILHLSAASYAQLTLKEKDAPLRKVFKDISAKSGYQFFYQDELLVNTTKVNFAVNNETLEKVLELSLKGQGLAYAIVGKTIVIKQKEGPLVNTIQLLITLPVDVHGRVTDSTGNPLPGANVRLKKNNTGVVTDTNGEFTLRGAEIGEVVEVSYISFITRQVTVTRENASNMQVSLKAEVSRLKEVMVSTGYQDLPRERATGSFEQLSNSQLNQKVSTDILSRLEGTSSILFDKRNSTATKLQIRGLYTLSENIAQPLVILDNFPYQGNINDINPNDIETITLLKDAAAASIWGARAGNGVIVITTKKARFNQKAKVSLNTNVTFTGKPDLFGLPVIPASEMIDLEIQLFKKGAYDENINNSSYYPALSPVVEILNDRRSGKISSADSAAQISALRKNDVRRDFLKYVYREQAAQQHQLDISGGSNEMNYRVSAGYDHNLYSLVGNDYNRYTFSSYTNIRPSKIILIQAGAQYIQSRTTNNSLGDYGSGNYDLSNSIAPGQGPVLPIYSRLADDAGNHLAIDRFRHVYIDTVGKGKLLNWIDKPLDDIGLNNNTTISRSFLADATVRISPFKSFNAEIKYRYQRISADAVNNHTVDSYFTRDMINKFTNLSTTSPNLKNPVPIGGILYDDGTTTETHNIRGQVNYAGDISKDSKLSALGGAEVSQTQNNEASYITYGYGNRLSVANVDYVNNYPRLLGGSATVYNYNGYAATTNRYVSVFANAAYTFKGRYVLSASARNDATNLFGVATRNKWKPLYSVGGSWDISDEAFYKSSIVPYLRIRATYGYQGNINNTLSGNTIISYSSASNNRPINIPFAVVFQPANPELRWENVRQVNIAADFRLLGGRISGTVERYWKKATDILAPEDADLTTGYSSVFRNSANISGNGLDVSLASRNIASKNFTWQTNFLLSYARYKVTKYLVSSSTNGFVSDGQVILPLVGYSPYEIVSYKFAGLDPATGDPLGYVNGVKSKDWDNIVYNSPLSDQVIQGSALPLYYGNLYNEFNVGHVRVAFNMVYKLAYFFRRPTVYYGALISNDAGNSDYLKRWTKPGDESNTNIPSFVYPNPTSSRDAFYQQSDVTVEKGDHIKLQTVQLGYNLLMPLTRKLGFSQLEVYGNADNLNAIIWRANNRKIDPDYPAGLKPASSFSLGIRAAL